MDVSVVISTYNGEAVLPGALESVLNQDAGDLTYEVIVVDNNSDDSTRAVVESFIARSAGRLRYVFEPRQGVSYGRNAGIAVASAPIIAFFDDDIRVARDWVRTLKQTLDAHPEVQFVAGKVLPEWQAPPPAWLTEVHWSPTDPSRSMSAPNASCAS
jgi:glycosyltransferase involved in cell wall biosynthesis